MVWARISRKRVGDRSIMRLEYSEGPWGKSLSRTGVAVSYLPATSKTCEPLNRRNAPRLHVLADELYDVIHGGARLKNRRHARLFQTFHILVGDNSSHQQQNVVHLVFFEEVC